MKLFSPTMMRIGVEWRATMLYSMVWNLVFADCLISLHSKLSVVNGVDARLTDHAPGELVSTRHCLEISSEASLRFINRAMLPMFYLGVACFSLGPATFLFDRTVKYNLAPFVFGLEGVLFCSFAATVYFVVLRKLCGELLQSMGFLQSQADAHSTVALEDKFQKYRTVYAVIWASGMKNVIQFSALGFFRFLIMVLPHWFTFFTLIEQVSVFNTTLFKVPPPLQSTTSLSSKYHITLFKVPHHPLQSTTPPSSKYQTTLFKVPHHALQSTTPLSSKYHTTLFKVPHHPLQSTTPPSSR